jgi:glycosyltransferase involved in cell wall biosynthesis
MTSDISAYRVAVILPCYNEAAAIGQVVREFRAILPEAVIYVYDNNSTDRTAELARQAGAVVRREARQGKGHVVRRMFADVEADIYVLADGDGTYDAASVRALIDRLVDESLDMVVGSRLDTFEGQAFRRGHRLGNDLLTGCLGFFFGRTFSDILSGYRIFSRRYVKSFPALSTGFETEIELTVHALELRMPSAEQATPYKARPAGSASKLRTYRDGWRILQEILMLFKEERPLAFFSIFAAVLGLTALVLAYPIFVTYLATGLVPRFPTAILSTGLMILAFLSLTCGLILDTVTRGRREMKRLVYLSLPALEKSAPR